MFHLIYSSKEKQEFTAAELKKLLRNARLRNHHVGVTGVLVYQAGTFLQALEGEDDALRTIFARIEKDPRHGDINILHRTLSLGKRRLFGDWSMGFADAHGAAQILKGFIDVNKGLSLSNLDKARAIDILDAVSKKSLQPTA